MIKRNSRSASLFIDFYYSFYYYSYYYYYDKEGNIYSNFCSFVHKFTLLFSDLVAVPQIWLPGHRFVRRATNLAAMPKMLPPYHNLAAVPQIWPPCLRFGRHATIWLSYHRFGCHSTDLAVISQIWPLGHRFGGCATKP